MRATPERERTTLQTGPGYATCQGESMNPDADNLRPAIVRYRRGRSAITLLALLVASPEI